MGWSPPLAQAMRRWAQPRCTTPARNHLQQTRAILREFRKNQ